MVTARLLLSFPPSGLLDFLSLYPCHLSSPMPSLSLSLSLSLDSLVRVDWDSLCCAFIRKIPLCFLESINIRRPPHPPPSVPVDCIPLASYSRPLASVCSYFHHASSVTRLYLLPTKDRSAVYASAAPCVPQDVADKPSPTSVCARTLHFFTFYHRTPSLSIPLPVLAYDVLLLLAFVPFSSCGSVLPVLRPSPFHRPCTGPTTVVISFSCSDSPSPSSVCLAFA